MLIKVKVFPGSKKEEIIKKKDVLEIKVKEKPENNKANKAVVRALASFFNLPEQKIRMLRGAKKRNKLFEIYD